MKICKDCKESKETSEYYGIQGECKECTKKRVKFREQKLRLNPDWVEKERIRSIEKYHRLNYKDKQKLWDKNKPWKKTYIYKNLSRKFKTPNGFELHHWNYNTEFLEDIVLMNIKDHRRLHTQLILNLETRLFSTKQLFELETKEKHLNFIKFLGLHYLEYERKNKNV